MSEPATLIYPGTIRFGRVFSASPSRLWEYLTVPSLLSVWLAEAKIDLCMGGEVELRFDVDEVPERKQGGDIIRGVISRFVPRQLLSYSWGESVVTFELTVDNKEVYLVLTHAGLAEPVIHKCSAGWHAHLAILRAHLNNEKPEFFPKLFEQLFKYYKMQAPQNIKKERRTLSQTGLRQDRRRVKRGSDFV